MLTAVELFFWCDKMPGPIWRASLFYVCELKEIIHHHSKTHCGYTVHIYNSLYSFCFKQRVVGRVLKSD